MKKVIIAMTMMLTALTANAKTLSQEVFEIQQKVIQHNLQTTGVNWKVGEQNNYKLDGGLFMKGSMVLTVKSIVPEGIWLTQVMDLGFMGKQNAEILIDPNTGKTLKMIVNGQEQAVPEQNVELVSMSEEVITVPAGTFETVHIVANDKTNNQEINQWINMQLIPINGMAKSKSPYTMGEMVLELTSFIKK